MTAISEHVITRYHADYVAARTEERILLTLGMAGMLAYIALSFADLDKTVFLLLSLSPALLLIAAIRASLASRQARNAYWEVAGIKSSEAPSDPS